MTSLNHNPNQPGNLLSGSAALIIVPLVSRLAGFAFVIVVARGYGEHDLGIYRFSLALVWYFLEFARLGLGPLLVRDLAAHPGDAANIWRAGAWFRLSVGVLGWVILGTVVAALKPDSLTLQTIALFATAMPFALAADSNTQALIAFEKAGWNLATEIAGAASFLGFGLLALTLETGITGLAAAKLVSTMIQAAVGWLLITRNLFPIHLLPSLALVRRIAAGCWPFALIAASAYFISEGDVLIMRLLTSFETVGVYVAAQSLISLAKSMLAALALAASPILARSFAQNQPTEVLSVSRLSVRLAAWLCGGIIASLAALAQPLVSVIYGASFAAAAIALQIASLVTVPYALCAILGSGIIAAGGERAMVRINLIVTAAGVIADLLLIPINPLIGAASASVLAYLLCLALYIYEARHRKVAPSGLLTLYIRPALASLGLFLALLAVTALRPTDDPIAVAALVVIAIPVYAGLLWLFGEIDQEMRTAMRGLLTTFTHSAGSG